MGGITSILSGSIFGAPDPLDIWGGAADKQAEQAQEAAQLSADSAIAAAQIQERTSEKALEETRRQYDVTRGDQLPFIEAGQAAVGKQQGLLGLQGQEAQQTAFDQYTESPGQAWLREQTMQGVLNNAAATGGLRGGNVLRSLQANAAGLASQDYGNYYNRLAGLSGTGQTSAANVGALGAQQSGLASNLIMAGGQAQASGILGSAQARASGLQQQAQMSAAGTQSNIGLAGAGLSALMMFSDINLKKDITEFTEEDLKYCYDQVINMKLYNWKYKEGYGLPEGEFTGTMYQESPDCIRADDRNVKALDIHKENMLVAGALQYLQFKGESI